MTVHSLGLLLAYVGALLGVAMVVPQIARTLRHPALTGVSPIAWALTVLCSTAWLTFGVRTGTWPQVPGNLLLIAGAVAIVLLVPSPWSRPRRAAMLLAATTVVLAASLTMDAVAVGYLGFAIGLCAVWPQLVDSYGNWRTGRESGLSLVSWNVKLLASCCWLAYALILGDRPVLIASTFALATILAVFAMETSARQSADDRAEAIAEADRVLEPA